MKFTVNVDCTPDEARAFMGLPDVKPLQEEMLAAFRDKALENMKMMEPDKMMQMWQSLVSQGSAYGLNPNVQQGLNQGMANMQDFFARMMTGAASGMASSRSAKAKKD